MIRVKIICLGKLKEKYWREAEQEYLKRLQAFAKVEMIELKEESFDGKIPAEVIKQKEADKINSVLGKIKDAYVIVLDEHGKQFSSVIFSEHLFELANRGNGEFVFVIGGPLGLGELILKKANLKLSFSSFTFTHQMIRVFLLEQIYRSAMIEGGRQYHY
ncbi:MAG: Ribosomal RNA large subunit methyltransferase H [uncultured bacterium]|nr:MAG: Ribosomal RNA large subunit methyltransferase H [uncultured bacterium]